MDWYLYMRFTRNCALFGHVGRQAKTYFCGVRSVRNEKLRQLLFSMQLLLVAHIVIKFLARVLHYTKWDPHNVSIYNF